MKEMRKTNENYENLINREVVNAKVQRIFGIIDGLTMPMVLCILGSVIVEIVLNAKRQGVDVAETVFKWLSLLSNNIKKALKEIENEDVKGN